MPRERYWVSMILEAIQGRRSSYLRLPLRRDSASVFYAEPAIDINKWGLTQSASAHNWLVRSIAHRLNTQATPEKT